MLGWSFTSGRVMWQEKNHPFMTQDTVSKRESLKSVINDILQEKDDASTVDSLEDSM